MSNTSPPGNVGLFGVMLAGLGALGLVGGRLAHREPPKSHIEVKIDTLLEQYGGINLRLSAIEAKTEQFDQYMADHS